MKNKRLAQEGDRILQEIMKPSISQQNVGDECVSEITNLLTKMNHFISSLKVVDLTDKTVSGEQQLMKMGREMHKYQQESVKLKRKIQNMLIANAKRGTVESSFKTYPTPLLNKALNAQPKLIARVRIPAKQKFNERYKKQKLVLSWPEFQKIHAAFIS